MLKIKQLIIAGLLSLLAVSSANAMLMMTVTDGTNTMVAADTDGDGYLNLTGSIGSWTISANSGFTNPFAGDQYTDVMHLNSVNVSGGVGSLTIMLTRVDFTDGNYRVNVGGTTSGTVDFAAYIDLLNTEYGMTTELYAESFGAGAFSGTGFGGISDTNYSTTLFANINHTAAGQITSFDFEMKVPEPAPMALMGLALLVLGAVARRRTKN